MTILNMSLGGALLIAVILLLRRLALYRLPKWSFLLLWAVALCRLLVPFAVPSPVSVYTGAARVAQLFEPEQPPAVVPDTPPSGFFADVPEDLWADHWTSPTVPTTPVPAPEKGTSVSPLTAVYWTGAALCGLFFTAACLWSLRRFWDAVPAEQDFVRRWQEEHPTLFPVQIKICGSVTAPLAYGLMRPVILLPANTDWSGEDQLTYILTHEYVHIRRGDLFWKLLLAGALCLHWFNPLVWLMYLRANQDLELACDERVVRILGLDNRKGYAYALLAAAESGFSPLCITYTTKHHMEERIRAIMNIKKKSVATILTAALLVTSVTAVFATSKVPLPQDIEKLPQAVMANALPSLTLPTPAEKDKPETIDRVHPVTGQPASSAADTLQEPGQTDPSNRWGVPANPIPGGTEIFAADEQDLHDLILYLRLERGYTGGFSLGTDPAAGRWSVKFDLYTEHEYVPKEEVKIPNGLLPDGHYPVNSRGETYGNAFGSSFLGYDADLIGVKATNGKSGYMLRNDYEYFGYPGKTDTPEEFSAFIEWQNAQSFPITLPVYDVNRDNIIGYFEVKKGSSNFNTEGMDLETAREAVEKNRWSILDSPIAAGTKIFAGDEQAKNNLVRYLRKDIGYGGSIAFEHIGDANGGGTWSVILQENYDGIRRKLEVPKGLMPDWTYPVNSKGETYGSAMSEYTLGYLPDLIAVVTSDGVSGYMSSVGFGSYGYPYSIRNPEEATAYMDWLKAQPSIIKIPVYDVEHNTVVGYYELENNEGYDYSISQDQVDEILRDLESGLRRNTDMTEEEIALAVAQYKEDRGWN